MCDADSSMQRMYETVAAGASTRYGALPTRGHSNRGASGEEKAEWAKSLEEEMDAKALKAAMEGVSEEDFPAADGETAKWEQRVTVCCPIKRCRCCVTVCCQVMCASFFFATDAGTGSDVITRSISVLKQLDML